jgi:YYY domain-containing protein
MREALTWYVVVQVAGLACWPLVARALAPLSDRGWALSKTAGLLGVAWLVWLCCMLSPLPFTRATLLVGLIVIAAGAWVLEARSDGGIAGTLEWLRCHRLMLIAWEIVFAATFILFGLLRSRDPAASATEKPMDMAFLNGFITAQRLPTQDSWLSGFGVPYYHFGYFVLACVAKLADVPAGVAYNLAAALVPALAMVALVSLVWSLASAIGASAAWAAAASVTASALALLCGNLSTFFEYLYSRGLLSADAGNALGIKRFGEGVAQGVWPPTTFLWWFKASRVIPNLQPDGINEFPFFSALLSDLHPHFVALPFELLVVSVAATHALSRGQTLRSMFTQGLGALALGGLLVINTWDIAPFWLLYIGLSLYAAWFSTWRWRWVAAVVTPFVGALLYFPYFVGYSGPPLGLGIVGADRTPLGSLFVLFGWAIVLLASLGLFVRWCIGDRRGWAIVGIGAALGVALAILDQPGLGVLAFLVACLLPWPGVVQRLEPAAAVAVGIAVFAAAMLLGVELVFLDDVFHSRMNTVFKFHENAWLLAGLASGVGIAILGRYTLRARWVVSGLAALFLVGGLVYPLSAIASRMNEKPAGGPSLDGIAFLSADDRAAVRWLASQNGAAGRVVIAEAVGQEYDALAGGMATYSGAVTVLGWAGHELQWRGPISELGNRQGDINALYKDAPPEAIRGLLDKYGVQYVVVGDEERRTYGDAVTTRFDNVLPVAFKSGNTIIYKAR